MTFISPLRMTRIAATVLAIAAGAAATARAQQANPLGGFKHDSRQPIEIVADSLEVRQTDQMAIFAGSVAAKQGDIRLQAQRVEVRYAEGGGDNAIRSLRAVGDVFISNAAETAQGDWADYDVANGKIRMGDDVVLTQSGSALRGKMLDIDLDTGQAKLVGRVEGVFKPR